MNAFVEAFMKVRPRRSESLLPDRASCQRGVAVRPARKRRS